jgi:hypothetical protein
MNNAEQKANESILEETGFLAAEDRKEEIRKQLNEQLATQSKSLVAKLAEVMDAVQRVPKLGENAFHRYKYATEADLTAAVRPELAKRGLIMVPNVKRSTRTPKERAEGSKASPMWVTDVEIDWTIRDGETGESLSFSMPGCGEDTGDKGLYKAITGSEKYALKNLFLIPTGDDPEKDDARSAQAPKTEPVRKQSMSEHDEELKTLPGAWKPGETGPQGTQSFMGVLEEVVQNTDKEQQVWTSGHIDGRRFYTKQLELGKEMLRFLDCDCEVVARPGKKPNDYQLLSIK